MVANDRGTTAGPVPFRAALFSDMLAVTGGGSMTFGNGSFEQRLRWLRQETVGATADIATPYGRRRVVYADYTASGRAIGSIESYLLRVLEHYGNTHTEDDTTGAVTTARLHTAEQTIKRLLNADDSYKLITVGSGATGAIQRLQMILGLYVSPVMRERLEQTGTQHHIELPLPAAKWPVVFVGPFEHHSNEISWRECYVDVREVELADDGLFDLDDLERQLSDPALADRPKIGSFSAASNVTGVLAPTRQIAALMHRHGGAAFFDFAALAPYVAIDVRGEGDSYYDGVYLSPHKYLGGPGSCGLLLLHERHYRSDLPPTFGAGGTVEFVDFFSQDYVMDVETREKPGTPPILQTLRAALALELQEWVGPEQIEQRERQIVDRVLSRLGGVPAVELVGNTDPEKRIGIVSFNVRHPDSGYLHPRFVVRLMDDLFGIQARAGCSCAGPYGHRLLGIDRTHSQAYKELIHGGLLGFKPGWVRVSFHYAMTDAEIELLCEAIAFVAENGPLFLQDYLFDVDSGGWSHHAAPPLQADFGLEQVLAGGPERSGSAAAGACASPPTADQLLAEARRIADALRDRFEADRVRHTEREDLIQFAYYQRADQ